VADTDSGSGPDIAYLEALMDFKISEIILPNNVDKSYILNASIGASLSDRAEQSYFRFDDFPEDGEITKAILNNYKDIVSKQEYASGEFYQQKLHAIATNILANLSNQVSGQKTKEEPKTNVFNFHSLSAPYNTKSFSKKNRYADNIAALDVVIKLEAEHRNATQQEQFTLAKYVGWED